MSFKTTARLEGKKRRSRRKRNEKEMEKATNKAGLEMELERGRTKKMSSMSECS